MQPPPSLHFLDPGSSPRLWGLTGEERLRPQWKKLGLAEGGGSAPSILLFRGDIVIDDATLKALSTTPDIMLLSDDGSPLAAHVAADQLAAATAWLSGEASPAIRHVRPPEIAELYNEKLRKRNDPYALLVTGANARAIEWRLFQGSYKGVTDLVTKYAWPKPAFHVTRACAGLGITPNLVTFVSAICVVVAFFCFMQGHYLPGLLAAWGMTFLDTVDGKLARCTLTSSPLGNVFDHGIDLVHPPFWYVAWGLGLAKVGLALPPTPLAICLWIVCAGYVLGRLFEGYFIARFKIELHIWRRFDSRFRLIVARRNPNLLILSAFALAGRPDMGLVAISIWTVIGILVHLVQSAQAELARGRGEAITSWLAA